MCSVVQNLKEEGRADMIRQMLSSGKSAEEISSFVGIPVEEVKEVEASMCAKA